MEADRYENVKRIYAGLRWYVGNNWTFHKYDILYISSNNDTHYDYMLIADGKRTFLELWKDKDNQMDDLEEIKLFLSGFSGNRTLLDILKNLVKVIEEQEDDKTKLRVIIDPLENV